MMRTVIRSLGFLSQLLDKGQVVSCVAKSGFGKVNANPVSQHNATVTL